MHKKPAPTSSKHNSGVKIESLDIDLTDYTSPGKTSLGSEPECSGQAMLSENENYEFEPVDVSQMQVCPHCGTSLIQRIHRGFIRKILLKSPPLYKCRECRKSFNLKQVDQAEALRELKNRSNNQ